MRSKCKVCSQVFEVEPPVADGQELVCPYCGKLTVYRAPTRIEVPPRTPPSAEARPPAEGNTAASSEPDLQPVSSEPGMQPVSRLRVIRPQNAPRRDSGRGNAMVDRVRARARDESRRQMLRKIGVVLKDIFWILVLLALVAGGWRFYRMWRRARPTVVLSQPMTDVTKPVDRTSPGEEKKASEESARPEVPRIQYGDVTEPLKGVRVSFYGLLPKTERLGAVKGIYSLVVPYGDSVVRYYGIESSPTGVVSAVRCLEGKSVENVTCADYEQELNRQGGFLVHEGVAYYVTRPNSPKTWNPPLKPGEDFCASKAYFGIAHELIRKQGWKTDDLRFEVMLSFGEKESPVPVATVRYGDRTSYAQFRKAAEPFALKIRSRDIRKPKLSGYKQTVVFTDGRTIGSDVNGITKVPRNAPNVSGVEYQRWCRLKSEAERQEHEARRIRSENEAKMREWNRQLTATPTDDEIEKALMAASVRVIRKGEK